MPSCCIVFTSDGSYLLPTLVSAMQARRFSSTKLADVLVIGVGLSAQTSRIFAPIFEREEISFLAVPPEAIDNHSAMLARLYLNKIVPIQYDQFLYLDGDVHIHHSLDPLLQTFVPAGHVMAADDPIAFLLKGTSPLARRLARYFHSVRIPRSVTANYFNSGVLRMPREGWDSISASALEHFRNHSRLARFPDQDALNIAAFGRRLSMSLAWNFPVFLRNARLHSNIVPRITHFMANPKPWHGVFSPWGEESVAPYKAALTRYPELRQSQRSYSPQTYAMYKLQQFGKRWNEALSWGLGARKKRILEYERQRQMPLPRPHNALRSMQPNESVPR